MTTERNAIDIAGAEYYAWGEGCDGWHLLKNESLSIIQERVPAGKSEKPHFHKASTQFFYVLDGEAVIITDSRRVILKRHQGLEIPPGVVHQFINASAHDVSFLVISTPKSHGDRHEP
jgi:mannose-6-phosphate isomerase-like protein (cupin superfamily)